MDYPFALAETFQYLQTFEEVGSLDFAETQAKKVVESWIVAFPVSEQNSLQATYLKICDVEDLKARVFLLKVYVYYLNFIKEG